MTITRSSAFLTLLLICAHSTFGKDIYHPRSSSPEQIPPHIEEADPDFWARQAAAGIARQQRVAAAAAVDSATAKARNVVIFLGDGMSVATLTAARTHLGQRQNQTGEESNLEFETFPTVGLSKTYCANAQIADSACSATAYLCGVKANKGTIGVTASVPRLNCAAASDARYHTPSIAAWALEDGRDAGIVTTTRVTHASPSGAYAHTAERDWESDADVFEDCPNVPLEARQDDIALQLIHSYPGNQFKVILGGGRRAFLPNTTIDEEGSPGHRLDGRNLIDEWKEVQRQRGLKAEYAWHRSQLQASIRAPPDVLLGLFEGNHLQYHIEADTQSEPTLAELTEAAIKILSQNPKGFFLFVESGRIDHAHHDNKARLALDETIALSDAVARASAMLPENDSLILVTSDHAHVMAFNGYSHRGNDVLGPSDDVDDNGVPYMTLSYTNGPSVRPVSGIVREDITKHNYEDPHFQYESHILLEDETHGGEDVAVFARGPQHRLFSGMMEQSEIPRRAAYAACLGPGPYAPACRRL